MDMEKTAPGRDVQEVAATIGRVGIYPNPGNGNFTLELNNFKAKKAAIVITDINGAIVEKRQVTLSGIRQNVPFKINNKPGIYIVKVISDDGVQTGKVLVER
jgi:hypothetical protein